MSAPVQEPEFKAGSAYGITFVAVVACRHLQELFAPACEETFADVSLEASLETI